MSRSVCLPVVVLALLVLAQPASAVPPRDSVGSQAIKDGAVKAVDVGSRQIQLRVKPGCEPGAAMQGVRRDGTVRCLPLGSGEPSGPAGGDLTGTYPNPELADGAVVSAALADVAVITSKLADDAVTSAKVANDSLTGADIDESSLSGLWRTAGNTGTDPANDFLGTTDNQPLNFRVNGARALRLEPGTSPNVIGGSSANSASSGQVGATIAGGGSTGDANVVSGNYGTVGGGNGNTASALGAAVPGGRFNVASGASSLVSGGSTNIASGVLSTAGGGNANTASGPGSVVAGGTTSAASGGYSSIGGGAINTASGSYSTIGGGLGNTASASYSATVGGTDNVASAAYATAIGNGAQATNGGATVIASRAAFPFSSTTDNEFAVRATGGSRIVTAINGSGTPTAGVSLPAGASAWSTLSDRNSKRAIKPVDERRVLAALAELPVSTWSWKADPGVRHMGPMAQDFRAAFRLGDDSKRITTVDIDGVALAAIKGLQSELKRERRKRLTLEERVEALEREVRTGG